MFFFLGGGGETLFFYLPPFLLKDSFCKRLFTLQVGWISQLFCKTKPGEFPSPYIFEASKSMFQMWKQSGRIFIQCSVYYHHWDSRRCGRWNTLRIRECKHWNWMGELIHAPIVRNLNLFFFKFQTPR